MQLRQDGPLEAGPSGPMADASGSSDFDLPTADREVAGGPWPFGDVGADELGDDGAWLTIAPGVQARADPSGAVPGAMPWTGAGGERAGAEQSSGGVHRASGDSMGTVGREEAELAGELATPGAAGGRGSGRPVGDGGTPGSTGTRRRRRVLSMRLALLMVALGLVIVGIFGVRALVRAGEVTAPRAPAGPSETAAAQPPGSGKLGSDPFAGPAAAARPGTLADSAEGVDADATTSESGREAPAIGAVDWWKVLGQLDERRRRALCLVDPAAVSSYTAPGSDFAGDEAALIANLIEDQLRPQGWRTTVIAIEDIEEAGQAPSAASSSPEAAAGSPSDGKAAGPSPPTGGSGWPAEPVDPPPAQAVVLTVVDERSAYKLLDDEGAVVRSVPESGRRRWRITLRRVGDVDTAGSGASGSGPAPTEETDAGLADARSAVADDLDNAPPAPALEHPWRIAAVEPVA